VGTDLDGVAVIGNIQIFDPERGGIPSVDRRSV